MHKKTKKRRTQKNRVQKGNAEAIRIMRNVGDKEAFYFYEDIGKPTGERAKSLSDFLEKIKSVRLESLLFHLQRKDFQNWIKTTLCDPKLARELEGIQPLNDNNLRTQIQTTIKNRIKELEETHAELLTNEDLAVVSAS